MLGQRVVLAMEFNFCILLYGIGFGAIIVLYFRIRARLGLYIGRIWNLNKNHIDMSPRWRLTLVDDVNGGFISLFIQRPTRHISLGSPTRHTQSSTSLTLWPGDRVVCSEGYTKPWPRGSAYLGPYSRTSYDIWPSRPIQSLRYIVTCTRIRPLIFTEWPQFVGRGS